MTLPRRAERREAAAIAVTGVVAAGAWAVATAEPLLLVVAPAAAGVAWLLTRPAGRLAFLVVGAALVFQVNAGLSIPKVLYLAGVVASVICALVRLPRIVAQPWAAPFRLALWGALLLVGWVGLVSSTYSLAVAGVPVTEWARDATTYLLISAAVVVGFDAAATLRPRHARLLTAGAGALFAFGFAATWLYRRTSTAAEIAVQPMMASMVGLIASFALAVALGLSGQRIRWHWVVLAAMLVGSVLVTGTRSGLALSLVTAGVVGFSSTRVRPARLAVGVVAIVAMLTALLPAAAAWVGKGEMFSRRVALAVNVANNGVGDDLSGIARARAYSNAARAFWNHPWFGQGVGHTFPNPNQAGGPRNFATDTPLMYAAKFGLIGVPVVATALLLIAAGLIWQAPRTVERTAAAGTLAVLVGLMPFGAPTDNKGFIALVALLMALVGAASRDGANNTAHRSGAAPLPRGDGVERRGCSLPEREGRVGKLTEVTMTKPGAPAPPAPKLLPLRDDPPRPSEAW